MSTEPKPMQPTVVYAVGVRAVSQIQAFDVGASFLLNRDPSKLDAVFKALTPQAATPDSLGNAIATVTTTGLLSGVRVAVGFSITIPAPGDVVWSSEIQGLLILQVTPTGARQWAPYSSLPQRVLNDMGVFGVVDPDKVYDYVAALSGGMLHVVSDDAVGLSKSHSATDCPDALLPRLAADLLSTASLDAPESTIRALAARSLPAKRERMSETAVHITGPALGYEAHATALLYALDLPAVHLRFRRWKITTYALSVMRKFHKITSRSTGPDTVVALRPPSIAGTLYDHSTTAMASMADLASWHATIYFYGSALPLAGEVVSLSRAVDGAYGYATGNGADVIPLTLSATFKEGTATLGGGFVQTLKDAATSVTLTGSSVTLGVVALPTEDRGSYMSAPTVSFSSTSGSGATATVTFSAGRVTSITVTSGGAGYADPPTVVFHGDLSPSLVIANLRAELASQASGDDYVDIATAGTLAPWGFTREGVSEYAGAPPAAAPRVIGTQADQFTTYPGVYWPTGGAAIRLNNYDGTALDIVNVPPDTMATRIASIADFIDDDSVVVAQPATDVVQDSYSSTGTLSSRPVATDKITTAGEFEILRDVFISGAATRTFAAHGGTFYRCPVHDSSEYLDGMLGVTRATDYSTLLRPTGQTTLFVSAP